VYQTQHITQPLLCACAFLCLQELLDAQLAAAAAAADVTAGSAAAADDAADDGQPSAPLIDLAGETTTEVPAGLLTDEANLAS
jgi:hypothetical protein